MEVSKSEARKLLKKSARIGMQRVSNEDLVKRPSEFEGIECYIFSSQKVDDETFGTWKVTPKQAADLGITEDELFSFAEKNTMEDTILMGLPGMTVLTLSSMYRGAGAILNKDAVKRVAEHYDTSELFAIPSSIHEWILIPAVGSIEDVTTMVNEVNSTELEAEEILGDRAYRIAV